MPTAERRHLPRNFVQGEPPRAQLTSNIIGAYREMPGLNLTLEQAARLFGLRIQHVPDRARGSRQGWSVAALARRTVREGLTFRCSSTGLEQAIAGGEDSSDRRPD